MEHYFTNNTNLKSELRDIFYTYQNFEFKFKSDNGVFSKNKIDYGSRLLVETYLKNHSEKNKQILDIGCGYGFMGIVLSKVLDSYIDMVDINKRAVHLANMNIKENKVQGEARESNIYENVNKKYDLIITNPPIRAGKKVVLEILINAKEHMDLQSELWFVIRKDQGAKSIMKELEKIYIVNLVKKDKGFYIISLKSG